MKTKKLLLIILIVFISISCNKKSNDTLSIYKPKSYVELTHPNWNKNAVIYEVNVRQYTAEGTFRAFENHLPRLKAMGVDILWLMPINPIGEKNRKGSLGSYYSVKDYLAVNPEFGTMDDFKHLVKTAHNMGFHVILDWVANHSAWDNHLVQEHPDWYTKSLDGNFQPTPWYDWDDIIDFDYNVPELRKYMTDAMKFWVKEADVDGFRCDVAGFIPVDFWENVRKELFTIKPVFMLAEWEDRDLLKNAFDMVYSWSLYDRMKEATSGGKGANALLEYFAHDVNTFPPDGYKMLFTDNHDKNSWSGNQFSNFKDGLETCMVLCSTANGMPLVYSGQEAGLNRSLRFFDKDTIVWRNHPFTEIYTKLFSLKHRNKALWNGHWGSEMIRVYNDQQDKILSFYRTKENDRVLVMLSFSNENVKVTLNSFHEAGVYTDLFSGEKVEIKGNDQFQLKPWGYRVLHIEK